MQTSHSMTGARRPARGRFVPGPVGAARGRKRAFTLVELLAVFSIIAVLLGVAAGYLRSAGKKVGAAASASTVETVIRACRDYSRGHGVPSRVVFDREAKEVWAAAQQRVGEWHFEADGRGYGNPGRLQGGATINPDTIVRRWGSLCDLRGGGWVDCGTSTAFDGRGGMLVEAWVYPSGQPAASKMVIFQKGKAFSLAVDTNTLELVGEIAIDPDSSASGNRITLRTTGFMIRPETWWHVALEYDGEAGRIHVNHIERAAQYAPGFAEPYSGASLLLSDSKEPFTGYLDEARFSVLVTTSRRGLETGVTFEEDYPPLRFDRDGNLDLLAMQEAVARAKGDEDARRRGNPEPIALPVEIIVGRRELGGIYDRRAIQVGYYGSITRSNPDAIQNAPEEDSESERGKSPSSETGTEGGK